MKDFVSWDDDIPFPILMESHKIHVANHLNQFTNFIIAKPLRRQLTLW
jgi:hypothetical protein